MHPRNASGTLIAREEQNFSFQIEKVLIVAGGDSQTISRFLKLLEQCTCVQDEGLQKDGNKHHEELQDESSSQKRRYSAQTQSTQKQIVVRNL
jgi:hypothetical protein